METAHPNVYLVDFWLSQTGGGGGGGGVFVFWFGVGGGGGGGGNVFYSYLG